MAAYQQSELTVFVLALARNLQQQLDKPWSIQNLMDFWPSTHEKRNYTTIKTVVDRACDSGYLKRAGKTDRVTILYETIDEKIDEYADSLIHLSDILKGKINASDSNAACEIALCHKNRGSRFSSY